MFVNLSPALCEIFNMKFSYIKLLISWKNEGFWHWSCNKTWFNSAWRNVKPRFDHHIQFLPNSMLKTHRKPDGKLSKNNSLHCVIYVRGVARIILTHHVDPELLIYWTLTSFICEVAAMWDSWWAISPEKNWETYHFDVYFLTFPAICLIWILMVLIMY